MDCFSTDSPVADKVCYFDRRPSRVRGFTALTVRMLHPALCKVMRLASVEVSYELTENVEEI